MKIERFEDIEAWQLASCTEVQSELYMALDQQYITGAEFQNLHDHAGRTRSAIRGFIKYLPVYEQGQRKKGNPQPRTQNP